VGAGGPWFTPTVTVTEPAAPAPAPTSPFEPRPRQHLVELPESLPYRIKKRILGPPLHTDQLSHERLGKPTALAVFASDNLSSSAYATEEILRALIPYVGVAAFTAVLPLTVAMLVVLGFLILSYRQTIREYPSAGGAYVVTKDNFGLFWAQVAGVALLSDYVLTVAVSSAAGTAALVSAVPALTAWKIPIAVGFVAIIAGGNLKGVKESGKAFAVPTYFFMANMVVLLAAGLFKLVTGALAPVEAEAGHEVLTQTEFGTGVFYGASLFIMLKAFASGGTAVTGVEAISNGVPAFREPAWRNAQQTLVMMGTSLGFMFLGLSLLASRLHPSVYAEGTPTVISQIGQAVYDSHHSPVGQLLWLSLQLGTMLILIMAANTSFADFPRLASFQASDNFLPRQLTKRGHRLVFSNGILALAGAAMALLLLTGASVEKLIHLYAIGVFLGFTLSQSGMAKHHLVKREPRWRLGLAINGVGALLSFVVLMIFSVTKFLEGAWMIIAFIPLAVIPLFRLNKQYESEAAELVQDARTAAEAPILERHVVIVLIDTLDMAAARAIQYARSLTPDELTAVHFDLDPVRTRDLTADWTRLGLTRLTLDVVDCPDRRIERGAAEVVARELLDGRTEVTVLIPRLDFSKGWHRLMHDRTADLLVATLSELAHCNVTIVPYHLNRGGAAPQIVKPVSDGGDGRRPKREARARAKAPSGLPAETVPADCVPISSLAPRQRTRVAGKVYAMRVQPWSGVAALELTVVDDSGALTVVFFGRRRLAGVGPGTPLAVEGLVGEHHGRIAMLNPAYEILPAPAAAGR
jgi:amino acid transporter